MRLHDDTYAAGEGPSAAVHYPESDGKPMGETDFHIEVLVYLRTALRIFFRHDDEAYVAGNMLFYYEEGNPKAVRSPDCFVVKGIAKHDRRTYKLWEEKAAPCVIFEITSPSTRFEDQRTKRELYERLGVGEYFLFDPLEEYLVPRFQGFKLVGAQYEPMEFASDGTLQSEALDLILRPQGKLLRLVDPRSGDVLPTPGESVEQAAKAREQAAKAREQAAKAREQAAKAREQTAEARQRADELARRASDAETEVARLRAELERLRRGPGTSEDATRS